jgi:23S rRNA G2445 N2-methylase RlmL
MTMKFHPKGIALLALAVLIDRIYPQKKFAGLKSELIDETVRRERQTGVHPRQLLDPYCGCGTAVRAALHHGRRFTMSVRRASHGKGHPHGAQQAA